MTNYEKISLLQRGAILDMLTVIAHHTVPRGHEDRERVAKVSREAMELVKAIGEVAK